MSASASPAPTDLRAMAEQAILRIIWPPDGRPAWEDRHKIPRIEQALGHLLDIVESDDVKPAAIKSRESQGVTSEDIRALQGEPIQPPGITATGLAGQGVTFDGRPAALRSTAPDQLDAQEHRHSAQAVLCRPRSPGSCVDHGAEVLGTDQELG